MKNGIRLALLMGALLTAIALHPLAVPAESAAHYREVGLQYRQQGRFPEAIAALRQAVAVDPEDVSSLVLLGWTLHLAGERQEAATVLEQAAYLDPSQPPTFNALGIVYLVDGNLTDAVLTHSWAIALKPDNEIAYYNLSLAFERLQQYHWAIATAQTAAELEPDNPHPIVAEAIAHWGKGNPEEAIAAYQRAMQMDGRYRSAGFLEGLTRAGFSQAQIERSQQILETVRPGARR